MAAQKIIIARTGDGFRACHEIVDDDVANRADPGPGQIRIRNHFAGVNAVYDQMMCFDRVPHSRVEPPVDAGVEAVGIVEAVGSDVDSLAPGDAVATAAVGGGYRHVQIVDASDATAVPAATPEVLALIPSGVSALVALEQVGEMTSGETVCVTAAAGGLGNLLVQLAVNAGNRVIAVCGGERKAAAMRALGVARVIDYRRESVADVLAAEFADRIDLALDSVGGELFDALLDNLAAHGRLVVCGFTSDRLPTEEVTRERVYTKLYWKAASIRGFMNYRFAAHAADARERLLAMLEAGRIRPLVDDGAFAGLGSVADAVEHLLGGHNLGKVVVDLRDDA